MKQERASKAGEAHSEFRVTCILSTLNKQAHWLCSASHWLCASTSCFMCHWAAQLSGIVSSSSGWMGPEGIPYFRWAEIYSWPGLDVEGCPGHGKLASLLI